MKRTVSLGFAFFLPLLLHAQSINEQVWAEYMLNYPFAGSFNLENAISYSTVLNGAKWRAYDYSPTLEWSVNRSLDLIAQTTISYTNQTETYSTFEIRPALGTRVHLTPNHRIQTRLLFRVEQRNFKNLETNEWEQVYRPRLRAEAIIPINQDSYYRDKLWYGMVDVEALFATDDVEERFANRIRTRVGAGYRLNYSLRFEFLYMNQLSRSGIDEDLTSSDHVFRFRLKHYLRKSKPSTALGTGN